MDLPEPLVELEKPTEIIPSIESEVLSPIIPEQQTSDAPQRFLLPYSSLVIGSIKLLSISWFYFWGLPFMRIIYGVLDREINFSLIYVLLIIASILAIVDVYSGLHLRSLVSSQQISREDISTSRKSLIVSSVLYIILALILLLMMQLPEYYDKIDSHI